MTRCEEPAVVASPNADEQVELGDAWEHPLDVLAVQNSTQSANGDAVNGPPDSVVEAATVAESIPGYRPSWLSSSEFEQGDYRPSWLVKRLIVRNQPAIFGGSKKTLKTTIIVDLAISSGTGTPFLGEFVVPSALRVAILSGESGAHTLQETARRICAARQVNLSQVDCLWGFRLPSLANPGDVAALAQSLKENSVKVLIIDPLYLCLLSGAKAQGLSAANLFDVGPLLMSVAQACLAVDCTPILIHHARKNLGNDCQPMDLEDLAFAGVQEFARQWLLVSRREPYAPGSGQHKLWITAGGSIGHGGTWGVDIDEGVLDENFGGRKWAVQVVPATEMIQAQKEEKKAKADSRTETKEVGWQTRLLLALDSMSGSDGIAGKNAVRNAAGLSATQMGRTVFRLQQRGVIEETEATVASGKKGGKRAVPGLRRMPTAGENCGTPGNLSFPELEQREGESPF